MRRRYFPAPFFHTLADLLKKGRMIFLHQSVDGGLALRIGEIGILVHQLQHRGERVVRRRHGLLPAPRPIHVDVAMPDAMNAIGFGHMADRRKNPLDFSDHVGEALGSAIEIKVFENGTGARNQLVPSLCRRRRQRGLQFPGKINLHGGSPQKTFLGIDRFGRQAGRNTSLNFSAHKRNRNARLSRPCAQGLRILRGKRNLRVANPKEPHV